jgi:hypothetical protein
MKRVDWRIIVGIVLLVIGVITLLPVAPLVLTMIPLEELMARLLQILL